MSALISLPYAGPVLLFLTILVFATIVILVVRGHRVTVLGVVIDPIARTQKSSLIAYNSISRALDAIKLEALEQAKGEIWFVGASMHHTFGNSRQALGAALERGVKVYLLVADPNGKQFVATASSFDQDCADLDSEARATLKGCRALHSRGRTSAANLEVRLVDEVFTAGAYFFDPRDPKGRMILVPHMPRWDAADSPGFVFGQDQALDAVEKYFRIISGIWTRGTPIEEWLRENPTYLAEKSTIMRESAGGAAPELTGG